MCIIFFFKQKTAYEMRISDWSSDVCSSDLVGRPLRARRRRQREQPCRAPFGEGIGAHKESVGLALDAAQRHRTGQEAGRTAGTAIVAGAEEIETAPRLERGGERPARLAGIIAPAPCARRGVDPAPVRPRGPRGSGKGGQRGGV